MATMVTISSRIKANAVENVEKNRRVSFRLTLEHNGGEYKAVLQIGR
jgi:hypothetical protein